MTEADRPQPTPWSADLTAPIYAWLLGSLVVIGVAIYGGTVLVAGPDEQADVTLAAIIGRALFILGAVLMALYFRTRVTIDARGLRLESALLRVPVKRIALNSIRSAQLAFIRPSEWGGRGYRVMLGRSAYVTEPGSGLVIETMAGKRFAITIPDAAEAHATLREFHRAANPGRPTSPDQ